MKSNAYLFPKVLPMPTFSRTALALAASMTFGSAMAAKPTAKEEALARKVDQLESEVQSLKAQMAELLQAQAQARAAAAAPPATGNTIAGNPGAPTAVASPAWSGGASTAAAAPVAAAPSMPGTSEPATALSGYAELGYSRPQHDSANAKADVQRFVLGYQHRFDEKTKVVTELEVEHAVSSTDDPGEVEVEQAFIEHQFHPNWAARMGLFLMPVGLLNENHEPDAYYGVYRNFVETAIIPTTWREGGIQFVGNLDNGWTLQAGLSTSFDLSRWDATKESEGQTSPLGSIHQEMAQANARDIAVFGAVNWRGIPGLQLGGSIFSGDAGQGRTTQNVNGRVTLWDLHARWTPRNWDLSALYARGTIGNTARLNETLLGSAVLIPKRFDGWYTQAAYHLWRYQNYALTPFVRYEQFNTGRSYAFLGEGVTPSGLPTEKVWTVGANFQLAPGVVLKADYQHFDVNSKATRIDLGVGWSF